ncbi:hypothetical protein [Chryseobacterium sp. 2987]|uniref:hypothetical protein n=1 Tax=Chryseobacterium sp. 2987 TaxID=2817767 RepID=UPI0028547597|nr:hypothetical protein [Chryseobacterium sp. 2987]MDR6922644.1 hypothetical protein [Chryseobacterium sp. 2987]
MEEGGWKLLLVIDTENLCKIKLAKKDGNLLLMTFRTSISLLPSSINQKFLSRTVVNLY